MMKKIKTIKTTVILAIFVFLIFCTEATNSNYNVTQNEVVRAISLELVPEELRGNYQKPITRLEFCHLIGCLLRSFGLDLNQISKSSSQLTFSDTDDHEVRVLATLGIVDAKEKGMFYPNATVTRQESAKMLFSIVTISKRMPQIKQYFKLQMKWPNEDEIFPQDFSDGIYIFSWAREAVNYLYRIGVFNIDSNGCIEPNRKLTCEEAIITILRLYSAAIGERGNPISEETFYPYPFVNNVANSDVLWGYIDSKGNWRIQPKFHEPSGFNMQGYATAQSPLYLKDSYMVFDKSGKIYFKFQRIVGLYGKLAIVDNGIYLLPQKKKLSSDTDAVSTVLIYPQGDYMLPIKDDKTNLYGYYSFDGKKMINFYYDRAYAFHGGKAVVKKKENYYLINKTGKVLRLFKIDEKKYNVRYFIGESGLLSSKNGQDIGYNAKTDAYFKVPQSTLTEDGWFIVTDTTDWKSKKLLDANGNTVALGKNIVDLGNGFYQVWANNDERFIVTNLKKVVIQRKNSKILNWISSRGSGGLAAFYSSEDTITIVDAFGTVFVNIRLPFKNCKVDFVNGLLRIIDTNNFLQYYYNPINGKRVLKVNP